MRRWIVATLVGLFVLVFGGARARAATANAETHRVSIGDSALDVVFDGALPSSLTEAEVTAWVERCGQAIVAYLGRFPAPQVRLRIRTSSQDNPVSGVTFGGTVPRIRLTLGSSATVADLRDDWVLTHEFVHLGFPDLTTDDSWAEEGLATYVEPLARVRVDLLSVDQMWSDLIDGVPRGRPGPGDGGLHGTENWGRTYWGGALFWLLADIGIREQTKARRGLPDALQAILDSGGDIRAHWSLVRTLGAADEALHVTVLSDLYNQYGTRRGEVDLDALWRRLGVRRIRSGVRYDNAAPLAAVRQAIGGSRH
jgi:hypothetical protein